MTIDPDNLDDMQKVRLVQLKDLFERTMPSNTSPVPTTREGSVGIYSDGFISEFFVYVQQAAEECILKQMKDQEVQTDAPMFAAC